MEFVNFAREYGLILDDVKYNRWVATPTVDHPRSSNGRYKFLGEVGWVQNWATMEKPVTWFADGKTSVSPMVRQQLRSSNDERTAAADKAAAKAQWILSQCSLEKHPYLERKGFPEELGNVWEKDGVRLLVIPMWNKGRVCGCQLIDHEGQKKFLHGQVSKGAAFSIGTKGIAVFCEGYATGLSVREVMKHINIPHNISVTFSASNMEFVSGHVKHGLIIADNDSSGVGQTVAKKTGKPYFISETVGDDFNDYHQKIGLFKASQRLKKLLLSVKI